MRKILLLIAVLFTTQLEAQSFSDFRDYKIKQFEQSIKSDTCVKMYVFDLTNCHVSKKIYEKTNDNIYFQLRHTYYSIYLPEYNIGIFAECNSEINLNFLFTIDKIRNQLFKYD